MALGGFERLCLAGYWMFDVGGSVFRIQLPSRAFLGVVWGHSGQTLDMSWYHRIPTEPQF